MNRELRAYMHTLGPPHLFVTLNVNNFSPPLVVRLSTGWGNKDDGVSETQGRGTLHLDILLWLKMAGTSLGSGGYAETFADYKMLVI